MVETWLDPDLGVAARLRMQAGHCERLGSPFYAALLEQAAEDAEAGGPVEEVLRGHEADPPNSMLALRLLGAVRRRVLEGALADMEWPAFRRALAEDAEAIRGLLDRPVQTNDVGRCAALLPGFLAAAEPGLPLRLLEVGSSAGLNLRWDRYRYEAGGFGWGDRESSLRIEFELSGDALRAGAVEVAERRGCDRIPIDPLTREGRLTLESFVWPDQLLRLQRLRTALAMAAATPVEVERAGATGWVADRLAEPRPGLATVVFHSIVMQYLTEPERRAFEDHVRAAGEVADADAPLTWLRMEPGGEMAEVRLTRWPGGEERLLARAGYHGEPVKLLG